MSESQGENARPTAEVGRVTRVTSTSQGSLVALVASALERRSTLPCDVTIHFDYDPMRMTYVATVRDGG